MNKFFYHLLFLFGCIGFCTDSAFAYKNYTLQDDCYPFLKSDSSTVDDTALTNFYGEIDKQIKTIVGNDDGCDRNNVCFCADTAKRSDSNYLLSMACVPSSTEVSQVQECDLISDENNPKYSHFVQEVSGCDGDNRCYKLNSTDEETKKYTKKLLGQIIGENQVSEGYLVQLNQENKGICLPRFSCKSRPLSAGMTMRSNFERCEEGLAKVGEHPNRFCADPDTASIHENMPHEIKFTLDPDSCEIKGFEYDEQGRLLYDPSELEQQESANSVGLAFVGEAESILISASNKEEVSFYPNAKNQSDDEKIKMISITDYKNMSFSKIIRGMEYLWGEADSKGTRLDWLTEDRVKLHLGNQAKASFKRYQVSRRLSEIIQTIESKKIFDLVKAEVDPEAEPLATIKAQIIALDVYKKLVHIELLGLRDLLGGYDFWDTINSPNLIFQPGADGVLYTRFKSYPAYKNSLAYLKNASNSLDRSLWQRKTDQTARCPAFCWAWESDCDRVWCNGAKQDECESGDDTWGWDRSGTHSGRKYFIRLCADEELKISGLVNHNSAFNGSLVNGIYPKSIKGSGTTKLSGLEVATGEEFESEAKFIENIKNGIRAYSNRSMSTFSQTQDEFLQGSSEFEIAQAYIDEFNNFPDTPQLIYNIGEINNMITGQYSCAFGENLKHVNLRFTAEEHLLREKNKDSKSKISLQLLKKQIQDFRKETNNDPNDPEKLDKLLYESSLNYLAGNIADIFIKMHFVKFQSQWTNDGNSGLLGGTSFWKNASKGVGFSAVNKDDGIIGDKVGKTLGYIDELYSMVEYMYKYRAGLLDGFEKQVTCLNDKVESFEKELGDINEERISNASSEHYAKIKEEAEGKVNETNEKIKQFITVQQRLAQLKNACGVEEIETTPGSSNSPDTPSGQVGNPEVSGFVDFQFDQQEGLGLGLGKQGFKKRTIPRIGKLGFGKLSFSGASAIENSAVGGSDSVSQAASGTGNVSGGSGDKKAKRSAKDEVKKVISGLNKLNDAKKDLFSKVKNASKISTGNILASIIRPDTVSGGISSDLGKSLRSTDFNKKKKVSKKVKAAKTKIKKRRSKSFRTKKRNKKFRKKITPKKARRNAKILRAIKKNPKRYNTLEKDSLFTRISKAIVRHGYPIFLKETNFDTELPSSKRKLYNSKNNDKYLD